MFWLHLWQIEEWYGDGKTNLGHRIHKQIMRASLRTGSVDRENAVYSRNIWRLICWLTICGMKLEEGIKDDPLISTAKLRDYKLFSQATQWIIDKAGFYSSFSNSKAEAISIFYPVSWKLVKNLVCKYHFPLVGRAVSCWHTVGTQ